jgi:hypothetical protein
VQPPLSLIPPILQEITINVSNTRKMTQPPSKASSQNVLQQQSSRGALAPNLRYPSNKKTIYDRNLNRSKNAEISRAAFAYLFVEMISYAQKRVKGIADLEARYIPPPPTAMNVGNTWLLTPHTQIKHARLPPRSQTSRSPPISYTNIILSTPNNTTDKNNSSPAIHHDKSVAASLRSTRRRSRTRLCKSSGIHDYR